MAYLTSKRALWGDKHSELFPIGMIFPGSSSSEGRVPCFDDISMTYDQVTWQHLMSYDYLTAFLLGSGYPDHFRYSVENAPRKVGNSCRIWSSDGSFESWRATLSKTPSHATRAIFRKKPQPSQTRQYICMLCFLGVIGKRIAILDNVK